MTPSDAGKTGREEEFTIKLAAISTAALCNTPESFEKTKIERDNPYWTIAYEDVRVAIQREMSLRAELSALRSRHDEMREAAERIAEVLRSSPGSGSPVDGVLRVAASILRMHGGGPVESDLTLISDALSNALADYEASKSATKGGSDGSNS